MKVLISLTYFTPHKSGLTVYAEKLAFALATRGHAVTVLTSRHLPELPVEETVRGVHILRLPVAFRLSKGVIMPSLLWRAWRLVKEADVVNLHLPQFEGAYLALIAKIMHRALVATHHSDLTMPSGWLNRMAGSAARLANRITAGLAQRIVHNTQDFAEHSSFLSRYLYKVKVIPPPIVVEEISKEQAESFRVKHGIRDDQVIIGMAARLASEKGVEYLVAAMEDVLQVYPTARVLFAGEFQHVIGEEAYRDHVMPLITKLEGHWTFLGVDSSAERTAFYQICRVLILPSLNNTESFGMVQVEALRCGTPVVASDLPGVRQPVMQSGFGELVPVRDSKTLASAILRVLEKYPGKVDARAYTSQFAPEKVAQAYEALFEGLI
jgi:glycosyltransferase involved in cell wall biosynthesis